MSTSGSSHVQERDGVRDFPFDAYLKAVGINKKEICRRVEINYFNLMRWQADNLYPQAFLRRCFAVCGAQGFEGRGTAAHPDRPWRLPPGFAPFTKTKPVTPPVKSPPPIAEVLRIPTEAALRAADARAAEAARAASPNGAKAAAVPAPQPEPVEPVAASLEPTPWREVIEVLLEMNVAAQQQRTDLATTVATLQQELADLRRRNRQLEDDIQLANELLSDRSATVRSAPPSAPAAAVLSRIGERTPQLQAAIAEVLQGKPSGS